MLYIPGHKRNAIKNSVKIPPDPCSNLNYQEHKQQMLGEDMEEKELSYTACRNIN
jgi:hypothetical protein